jgi:AcrR family transcriptional regulator
VVTVEGKMGLLPRSLVHQEKRTESMISGLEAVALALFEARQFSTVTVEEIVAEAQIMARTFYRYFPVKDNVLPVRIRRRAEALKAAMAERPSDEPPLPAGSGPARTWKQPSRKACRCSRRARARTWQLGAAGGARE